MWVRDPKVAGELVRPDLSPPSCSFTSVCPVISSSAFPPVPRPALSPRDASVGRTRACFPTHAFGRSRASKNRIDFAGPRRTTTSMAAPYPDAPPRIPGRVGSTSRSTFAAALPPLPRYIITSSRDGNFRKQTLARISRLSCVGPLQQPLFPLTPRAYAKVLVTDRKYFESTYR